MGANDFDKLHKSLPVVTSRVINKLLFMKNIIIAYHLKLTYRVAIHGLFIIINQ